jgi:hypothetical protein
MLVRTNVKAGGIQHAQAVVVKTGVKGGGKTDQHAQSAVVVRTSVKAGAGG